MFLISMILMLAGGFCQAFQSPTNAALAEHTGSLRASVISFGSAAILLALAVLLCGSGDLTLIREASWWQLFGGLYGAYMVLILTIASPVLGIALTLTFNMLGQIIMGILIDLTGMFHVDRVPPSLSLTIGCLLVMAGIFCVYIGRRQQAGSSRSGSSRSFLLGFLTLIGGMASAIQAPTNTALAEHIGRMEASFVSFTVGLILLLICALILGRRTVPAAGPGTDPGIRPWMLTGGAYGAANVVFTIIATPVLGVALVMSISMLGQLTCALLIDSFGLMRAKKIPMNHLRLAGIVLIAAGIVMVTIGRT